MTEELAKKYSLRELAQLTHTQLIGNPDHLISGVEALESATSEDASFLANPRYREAMITSSAGVIFIDSQTEKAAGKNYLVSENPSLSFQTLVDLFLITEYNKTGFLGIHPSAVIHPSAKLGKNVQIGPYVTIDQGAQIGDDSKIMSFVSIGPGAKIGSSCLLYPHAVVREKCILGDRVILQPGAVIGSCGFGYSTDAKGRHTKLDQLGIVVIEDDVEIGANTTIDRARFKMTIISQGTKIDNLVQIGHNVKLGPNNIIVSQSGIAGSAKTGRNVVLGGQAGIVGHLEITDGVMIATRGGVSKSISKAGKYAGGPVMPLAEYNRQQVHLRKISEYVRKIEELEKRIQQLESQKIPLER
jgi:UDP-3-O-[3-hydroxymyristoyl] glucosamine N-acyltransferase